MCAAYARADHKEAADRKLAIKTLWYSAGRASEPGFLSYDGLRWNELHQTAVIESFQSKPRCLARATCPFPARVRLWTRSP